MPSNPVEDGVVAIANVPTRMRWAVGIKHHWRAATGVEKERCEALQDSKLVEHRPENEHIQSGKVGKNKTAVKRASRDTQSHSGRNGRSRTSQDGCSG